MFTISKRGDYGLELLTVLAKKGQATVISLKDLTKASRLPYRFASQLAVSLKAAGILGSREGIGGGYFLAKEPEKVTVAEVVAALEGEEGLVHCSGGASCLRGKVCQVKSVWGQIQNDIKNIMSEYTVADLVRESED
ncbi:hypothetical protein A2160_00510 [Candidatus Beckwithbacteria bacterium RBG_13_42_9]|uniref:Rrf2 family transcriptional regulator n=1 Tax=Candidatus Beckwithbacteria bacterium RBG_13_42_9 TaxID=1797457 RepID=A0A1F5E402_9BACT|nr:MAG: hypothetical protein A2160_00510 [Candidatus Beckwithbacteria bacterium RBG_13_42_9]